MGRKMGVAQGYILIKMSLERDQEKMEKKKGTCFNP